MSGLSFRKASLADIDFVARAIAEAERSGTPRALYERVFDLSAAQFEAILKAMLNEELPGSELGCDQFWLATDGSAVAGGLAAWIEGAPASGFVRANSWAHALGAERWAAAAPRLRRLREVDLPREAGALQIEAVYVAPEYRGRKIVAALIEAAWAALPANKAQILSMIENEASARAFRGAGFDVVKRSQTVNEELLAILPGSGRLLWERARP